MDFKMKILKNRKFIILAILIVCNVMSAPAFADSSSVDRQTTFNDLADYLAALGKSGKDRQEILQDRRDIRRETRLKSEERRKQSATRKRMKAQEQAIMQKLQAQSR